MLLVIDAGNTNVVFAVYDGETIRAQWRAVTKVFRTADEYAVWLSQLLALEGLSLKDLDAAIIATVVPAVLFDLLKCLKDECGFDFLADVAGIDYLNYPGAADRYGVVYALANTATAQRVFVKAFANDPDPELPSAVPLWAWPRLDVAANATDMKRAARTQLVAFIGGPTIFARSQKASSHL